MVIKINQKIRLNKEECFFQIGKGAIRKRNKLQNKGDKSGALFASDCSFLALFFGKRAHDPNKTRTTPEEHPNNTQKMR